MTLLIVVWRCLTTLPSQAADGVRVGYKAPVLVIPDATVKPKLDGIIDDIEWQGALSLNALATTEGKISTRQTRCWLMWDEDNFYLAMRSPLRPGERVLQAARQTERDSSNAVYDDSYEIWLNANTTSPDGQKVFFQYLGNYAEARYDVMFEPAVGNSRPGWTSGWKPVNRLVLPTSADKNGGSVWEMEVAIPCASIYHTAPFADGEELHGLFVRSFKRPWEQNSIGGSGSFSAGDTHSRLVLSRSAPAVHLLGVADPVAQTLGVKLAGYSAEARMLKWSMQSDAGTERLGKLELAAGKFSEVVGRLDMEKPGAGFYRIRVTSDDGQTTYLDWSGKRMFGVASARSEKIADTVDQLALNLTFNPMQNYVRVAGDLINYDQRGRIVRFHAEVLDSSGKKLIEKRLPMDRLAYVQAVLPVGDCPGGGGAVHRLLLRPAGSSWRAPTMCRICILGEVLSPRTSFCCFARSH